MSGLFGIPSSFVAGCIGDQPFHIQRRVVRNLSQNYIYTFHYIVFSNPYVYIYINIFKYIYIYVFYLYYIYIYLVPATPGPVRQVKGLYIYIYLYIEYIQLITTKNYHRRSPITHHRFTITTPAPSPPRVWKLYIYKYIYPALGETT